MDPTYPLVPIANFLACVLVVIPLAHMLTRPWNTGVYFFALWTLLSSLSTAINTLVWSNNVKDRAPIWCDICKSPIYFSSLSPTEIWLEASHIDILVNTGIPACSLSITRRLYKITTLKGAMINRRQVTVSSSTAATECWRHPDNQRRIELALELVICIGIPIVIAALCECFDAFWYNLRTRISLQDYIVQGARYAIFEELGCLNTEIYSGLSVILIDSWAILFPVISLVCYTRKCLLS